MKKSILTLIALMMIVILGPHLANAQVTHKKYKSWKYTAMRDVKDKKGKKLESFSDGGHQELKIAPIGTDTFVLNTADGKMKMLSVKKGKKWSYMATYISTPNGKMKKDSVVVDSVLTEKLTCVKYDTVAINGPQKAHAKLATATQLPDFNSRPGALKCIWYDLDGGSMLNLNWYKDSINYEGVLWYWTDKQIRTFLNMQVIDFPLDVTITTSKAVYDSYPDGSKTMVVVTPTSAWYGIAVGGVAYVGITDKAWYKLYAPAWVFINNLNWNEGFAAEAATHEEGHQIGCQHQPDIKQNADGTCTVTSGYNNGTGTWATHMGSRYDTLVAHLWGCTVMPCAPKAQDDLAIITPYMPYLPDDNTTSYNVPVTNNSFSVTGMIEKPDDSDVFTFPAGTTLSNVKVTPSYITYQIIGNTIKVSGNILFKAGVGFKDGYGCFGVFKLTGTTGGTPPVVDCSNFKVTSKNVDICKFQSTQLTATSSSPATYKWTPSVGLSSTTTSSPLCNTTVTSQYTILATSAEGCTSQASLVVTINPNPTISITASTSNPVCKDSPVSINATGASSYTWAQSSSAVLSTSTSITVLPLSSTTYSVTGKSAAGCSGNATYIVTVKDCTTPTCKYSIAPADTTIALGKYVLIYAPMGHSYKWSDGSTRQSINPNPTVQTTYSCTITNSSGCSSASSSIVRIAAAPIPCDCSVYAKIESASVSGRTITATWKDAGNKKSYKLLLRDAANGGAIVKRVDVPARAWVNGVITYSVTADKPGKYYVCTQGFCSNTCTIPNSFTYFSQTFTIQ